MITEHEPGGYRDRCGHCGGWISLGHAVGSECRERAILIAEDAEQVREKLRQSLREKLD